MTGVATTCDLAATRENYFTSLFPLNPSGDCTYHSGPGPLSCTESAWSGSEHKSVIGRGYEHASLSDTGPAVTFNDLDDDAPFRFSPIDLCFVFHLQARLDRC